MTRWLRSASIALACLGSLLVAGAAHAQSITINNLLRPEWDNDARLDLRQVNRADCVANDLFNFHLTLSGLGTHTIEVWEGTACELDENRDSAADSCVRIFQGDSTDNVVPIRVQEMFSGTAVVVVDGGGGAGGAPDQPAPSGGDVCNPTSGTGAGSLNLYFLVVSGDRAVANAGAPQVIPYDFLGPEPPVNVKVSIGEGALVVTYDESTGNNADLTGYQFFCDEGCASSVLVEGASPPLEESYECGRVNSMADEGQADGLTNGATYTVAVSATDQYGNPGPLSAPVCGTPELVTGFYEAYRAAGGQAGGAGICAISGPGRSGLAALSASALLLLAAAMRRHRSPRRRS